MSIPHKNWHLQVFYKNKLTYHKKNRIPYESFMNKHDKLTLHVTFSTCKKKQTELINKLCVSGKTVFNRKFIF